MAKKAKPVKAEAPALSLEELIQQKVAAGLNKEQATRVAKAQLARDAGEILTPSEDEEEESPTA